MDEKRIADRVACSIMAEVQLPATISRGKMLGGFRIEEDRNGHFTVYYGGMMGVEFFKSWEKVRDKILPWLKNQVKKANVRAKHAESLYRIIERVK